MDIDIVKISLYFLFRRLTKYLKLPKIFLIYKISNRFNYKMEKNQQNIQGQIQNQQIVTNYTITSVLTSLIQKLSNLSTQNYTKQQILIKLLQKIDGTYFQYKFSFQQAYDYQTITKSIIDYYNDKRYERIKKIFMIEINYVKKFQHIFQLVLDLAITCNQNQKQRYIEEIIGMGDRQKQILMPYFDQVMKRKFVQNLSEFKKYTDMNQVQHTQQDQLLQAKDQEYQELKQNFEEIYRMYNEILDNHNNLKVSYQKILNENSQIVQEKYQLMNQLGVHPSSNFIQISDKYKKDIKQYEGYIEKLSKDLDQKNSQLKTKEKQIKQITANLANSNIWQKQKNSLVQKSTKLQNQLKILQQKQKKVREQLQNSKEIITKLKQNISQKEKQLSSLIKFKNRYKGIKQVHVQFKRNFVERMKQT